MTIIWSIILFIAWSFSFLTAIRILKVSGHYINRYTQYSTARTASSDTKSDTENLTYSCSMPNNYFYKIVIL